MRPVVPHGTARRIRNASLGVIAAVSLSLLALAGCDALGEKYVEIEWYASYFENYYPRWMEDFEKAHADENVRIKFRAMPSNAVQKIYTMLISHSMADVVVLGSDTAGILLDNNALVPVPDDLIDRKDYMPLTLDLNSYVDGRLAAVPHDSGLRPFIYFDAADMEEVGTTAADVPEGSDAYREWAGKFFKWDLDGRTVLGPLPEQEAARATLRRRPIGITRAHVLSAYPFILAYIDPVPSKDGKIHNSLDEYIGGPPLSDSFHFDTPEFVRGLQEWQKFFVPKTTAIADGDTERLTGLQSDVYAGCEAGNWIFGEVFTIDMQVTSLPHADGKPLRLSVTTSGFGVSNDCRNKGIAFEWAKYVGQPNQQVDAYYGHGYLPSSFTAWNTLDHDDKQDKEIRERFLGSYRAGNNPYLGEPQIKRTSHDSISVLLFVPLYKDLAIVTANSWEAQAEIGEMPQPEEGEEEGGKAPTVDLAALARQHSDTAKKLADDVAAMTGERVSVIVRGTPPEMEQVRSRVPKSPVPVYIPLLDSGVYPPNLKVWSRISAEVIARAIQFVSKEDDPMSCEEAAKWCQDEATAILEGRK